jgi:hypothetical protein
MRWVWGLWVGAFLFGTTAGWGADWQFYAKGEEYEFFYDAESITAPDKNQVKVWVKIVADEEMVKRRFLAASGKIPADEDLFSYQKLLTEINCAERKQRNLTINNYSKNGKYLSSSAASTLGDWQMILPESFGDMLYKKVCK